ncbi:MAG: SulP family inorganic anion transporter [Planctomycetota bacterium]
MTNPYEVPPEHAPQPGSDSSASKRLGKDLSAGLVVFLVALPLCLGIALASGVNLFAGLLAGIIGGLIVGPISGSHTSVSGPAAGLTAIVLAQVAKLETFDAFLLAVLFAGVLQICLGIARAGALSAFFPSSVIKGLLAAIGVILILKQIPHLFGHDKDPEGEMSFVQPDGENTFSEIWAIVGDLHIGASVIGLVSLLFLLFWERTPKLKKSIVPAPLIVVVFGVLVNQLFALFGEPWLIEASHLVQIPVAESFTDLKGFLTTADFSQWNNPDVYMGAITIAIVASLETLLNLEAVDKLDTKKRHSPPSRELIAQGAGNIVAGLVGALPVTSVIVRSSVNVNVGAETKRSTIFHGMLLLGAVAMFPVYMNMIPLAALAAILLATGLKLASPALFKQMWSEGRYQFAPFIITLVAIVWTDLLIGILIGLAVSVLFILNSSLRQPIRRIVETHLDGDLLHVELSNQVSFLNRAALDKLFNESKRGSHLLIDASNTNYIDPDILSLIRDFKQSVGPARGVEVSLRGFRSQYQMQDELRFADFSTRELQDKVTPDQVLEILKEGNRRFRTGNRLTRDFNRAVGGTAAGQNPLAAVLSCIDSRVPNELVFDLGIGDIFSVRVAGNVIGTKSLASLEYCVKDAGVKLVLVLGHTRSGTVKSSLDLLAASSSIGGSTGHGHLQAIVDEIEPNLAAGEIETFKNCSSSEQEAFIDEIAKRNVLKTVQNIIDRSEAIRTAMERGQVAVIGALYDVKTGNVEFLQEAAAGENVG